jgi:hypothetical protein
VRVLTRIDAIGAAGLDTLLSPADDAAVVRQKTRALFALSASQCAISLVDGFVSPETVEIAAAEGVRFGTGPRSAFPSSS